MSPDGQLPLFGGASPIHSPGGELPDADARAFAMDPAENVVLEASAGTGKTSVLVGRYLNLLKAGVAPSNILALTFTRKAAAEMRERIVLELRGAAARSEFDRARWRDLRDRLGDIAIGTIDAFCLALLREFPLEADLDPGFTLIDETEVPKLVEQAIDGTVRIGGRLAETDSDLALVFAHVPGQQLRRGLAHLVDRRLVARPAIDRFLASVPDTLSGRSACVAAIGRLRGVLEHTPARLERFVTDGPHGHPFFALLAREFHGLGRLDQEDEAGLRRVLDLARGYFLTRDGSPRVKLTGFRVEQCASKGAWQRHRLLVAEIAPAVRDVLAALDRDVNAVLVRGVRRLLAIALSEYRRSLDAHRALDFTDTLARALGLVRQMDEFAQSRYRLESRYHHVLVDEFQDTSRAQWDLVSLLVQSWGEGLGLVHEAPLPPSIFIVGDRKQSIYRFRDAEVSVLEEAGRRISALRPTGPSRRTISTSFRAVPGLLAFINDLFTRIADEAPWPDGFRYDARDVFPVVPQPSGVASGADAPLGIVAVDRLEACAAAVAGEVARLIADGTVRDRQTGVRRPTRPGDIAILFRTRETHRAFEVALETRGIPNYVYKGLGFFEADEIKDVTALLRYLANPASDARAAAFLRSRVLRLSDDGVAALAPDLAASLTAMPEPATVAGLSDEDRQVVRLARESLVEWLRLVDRLPPVDLLDRILAESAYAHELRGPRRLQARENLKKLRQLLRRVQNRGYATVATLAEHVDHLSTGDEANAVIDALDAVNLLTVHAAKGLEFPIVFVVNLTRGTGGRVPAVRVTVDPTSGEPSVSVGAYRGAGDEDERRRDREETKRLLYVALTRARDRLYLAAVLPSVDARPSPASLAEIMPASLWSCFQVAAADSGAAEGLTWRDGQSEHWFRICRPSAIGSEAVLTPPAPVVADDFGPSRVASAVRRATVTSVSGVHVSALPGRDLGSPVSTMAAGTLVHQVLQTGMDPAESPERIQARVLALARSTASTCPTELVERVVRLYRSLSRPDVAALLRHPVALHEVEFSMRLADENHGSDEETAVIVRGTIDCLVAEPGGPITVVEVKTGRPEESHDRQLDLYVQAARQLFPGAEVRGALVYAAETPQDVSVRLTSERTSGNQDRS